MWPNVSNQRVKLANALEGCLSASDRQLGQLLDVLVLLSLSPFVLLHRQLDHLPILGFWKNVLTIGEEAVLWRDRPSHVTSPTSIDKPAGFFAEWRPFALPA